MKVPWSNLNDYYESVDVLISALREHGFEKDANILDQILHGCWTTGSELLGELTFALEEINHKIPREIMKSISLCHYFAKHHRRILKLN